jgi:threonine/homoserine/homoserine lactone efflux protein
MFDIIIKGLTVGLFISVPVGPIAVLCIQRTLNRGKYHGFVTGLGAAASDLLYATITTFCLSFVLDFIHDNQFFIEIIGAIIMFLFGLFLFRTNPVNKLSENALKKESYFQDFITSFALTITNPLIIFLFIAVFARFSFIEPETTKFETLIGLFSVLIGASVWWFSLTSLVNVFRSKFNLRGLSFINKISGSILIAIAILGFIYSIIKHLSLLS